MSKIILTNIDEKKKRADFTAVGVRLNRFVDLFTPSDHPNAPGKMRYSATFHIEKDAEGMPEFFALVRKFLALDNNLNPADPKTEAKLDFLIDEKAFIADGDLTKPNPETGKPYANNANTWIIKPYAQERDKSGNLRPKPDVFAKYAYKDGMTIPEGCSVVGGAKKFLKKALSAGQVQGGDFVNVQCQIYCAMGRVCCSFVAVQLVKQGERYSQGADYDAFADFEDSEDLPEMDFSSYMTDAPADDVPDFRSDRPF